MAKASSFSFKRADRLFGVVIGDRKMVLDGYVGTVYTSGLTQLPDALTDVWAQYPQGWAWRKGTQPAPWNALVWFVGMAQRPAEGLASAIPYPFGLDFGKDRTAQPWLTEGKVVWFDKEQAEGLTKAFGGTVLTALHGSSNVLLWYKTNQWQAVAMPLGPVHVRNLADGGHLVDGLQRTLAWFEEWSKPKQAEDNPELE